MYSVFVFRLGYCGLVFMIWNFVFGVGNSVFLFKLGYYVIIFILMYSAVVFNKGYYGYPAFAYVGSVHEVFLRIAIYIYFQHSFPFGNIVGCFLFEYFVFALSTIIVVLSISLKI